jgi:hypothetical protein
MIPCTHRNTTYLIIVGAVQAESLISAIDVHAVILRLEFLTAHRRPVMHGAYRNPFDISAILEVNAVPATLYFH